MFSSDEGFGFRIISLNGSSGRNTFTKGASQVGRQHEHTRLQIPKPLLQTIRASFVAAFAARTIQSSDILVREAEAAKGRQVAAGDVLDDLS